MARYVTIKENRDFSRIYRRGKSFVSPVLVTYVIKSRGDKPRYGITTGKDQYYIVWLDDDSMIALAANGKDGSKPQTLKVNIDLQEGNNVIRLWNDGVWLPDIDKMELD